jgi:hypothetical protein
MINRRGLAAGSAPSFPLLPRLAELHHKHLPRRLAHVRPWAAERPNRVICPGGNGAAPIHGIKRGCQHLSPRETRLSTWSAPYPPVAVPWACLSCCRIASRKSLRNASVASNLGLNASICSESHFERRQLGLAIQVKMRGCCGCIIPPQPLTFEAS